MYCLDWSVVRDARQPKPEDNLAGRRKPTLICLRQVPERHAPKMSTANYPAQRQHIHHMPGADTGERHIPEMSTASHSLFSCTCTLGC